MKLTQLLKELDTVPFHMPGHKRNPAYPLPCADIDITEIDGFDNLHHPESVLRELQDHLPVETAAQTSRIREHDAHRYAGAEPSG